MQINPGTRYVSRLARSAMAAWAMALAGSAGAAQASTTAVSVVRVAQASISQPVQAFGVVGMSASQVTAITLPYTARIVRIRAQAGQPVRRGAVIALVQADPAAIAAMQQATTSLQVARNDLQRTEALYGQSLATQSQLDAARKAASDARTNFAAQQKLGVAAGTIAIAAPVDGVVTRLSAAQGDQIQAGTAIAQLASTDGSGKRDANVSLSIDPSSASWVHVGDTVTVRSLSAAQARLTATGRVTLVGESIDPQTQMIDVGAAVALGEGFFPGTRVRAEIATRTGVHWIVPRSAVLTDSHGAYVFQVSGTQARRIPVTVRVENGDRYGVDGALDAARLVVDTGNYELQDGASVSIANHSGQPASGSGSR